MAENDDFHLWKVDGVGALLLFGGLAACLFSGFVDIPYLLAVIAATALIGTFFLRNVRGHLDFFLLSKRLVFRNCYLGAALLSLILTGFARFMGG
tara:strand:- start:284 stop:568 length:285 start_codon:yes stop_codon:yes gene_type:complete